IHLTRAAVEAASSSASVFVHSLPTIQALQGTDGRLTGPIPHKAAHPARPGGGGLEGASPGDPGPPQDRKAEIAARSPPSCRRIASEARPQYAATPSARRSAVAADRRGPM